MSINLSTMPKLGFGLMRLPIIELLKDAAARFDQENQP